MDDQLNANVKIFNKELIGRDYDDDEKNGYSNPFAFLMTTSHHGKKAQPVIVLRDIHFRIGLLLAALEQEWFSKENSFLYLSFLQTHKNKCSDEYCFCRRRAIVRQWQGPNILMNQDFLKRYILKLVQRMGEEFKGIRGKYSEEVVILFSHYVHTLNEFDQPVLALSQLSSMQSRTKIDKFFEGVIIGLMNHHIKLRMSFANASTKQGDKTAVFTKIVDSFLVSEVKATVMKAKISQLVDDKIKLFQEIVGEKFDNSQELYDKLNRIAEGLMATESGIMELYYNYPSVKQRSVMSFFQAELMNNFKQANHYQHLTVINEVSKLYAKSHFDFFSPDIIYLVVAYGREKGKIKSSSSNAAQFFGYEKEQFEFVRTIEDLIPAGISGIHDVFVSNFFQFGQSGLFRNLGSSLAKLESGFIHPIQLLFDINFLAEDDFSFITFMRKMKTNNVFLVVSESGKIGGISENFYERIGAPAEINRDILLKLSQNLNVNNLIPSFSDLMSQMKKENAVEAKHFDISLRFIKDLDQFVQTNNDFLNSGKASELSVKGIPTSKKKKIRKSMKDEGVNAAANQATMNFIRKSSFFNEGAADSIRGPSRTSVSMMSASRLHNGSDPSDQHSQYTWRSGKSSKSFVSRRTIGWKRNRMQKFVTNIVIRIRDFTSEDVRMSFKYAVLELEELRRPNENDFFTSKSDSMTSATMTQRSFVTMRSGKSVNTLVSGSGKFSKGSNDDSEPVRADSQNEDNGGGGVDAALKVSKYNFTSANSLEPIAEEGGQKKKNDVVQKSSGPVSTSIFSGKKQLGWVTRIQNLQKEREEKERQEEIRKAEIARQEEILKQIEKNQKKIEKMIKVKDLATNLPQSSIENEDNNSASASGKQSFISLGSEIAKEKQTIKTSVRSSTNQQMTQRMQQLKEEMNSRKVGQFPRKMDMQFAGSNQMISNYQASQSGVGSGIYIEEEVTGTVGKRVLSEMDTAQRQRNEIIYGSKRMNSMTNEMVGSLRKEPNSNITSMLSDGFPTRQLLPYYEIGNHKNYFDQEEAEDIESLMLLQSNNLADLQGITMLNDSVKQQTKRIKAAAEEKRNGSKVNDVAVSATAIDNTASTMKSNLVSNQKQEQISEVEYSPGTEKVFNISGNRLIDSPIKVGVGSENFGSRAADETQSQQKFFNKSNLLDLDAASQSQERNGNLGREGGGGEDNDNSSIGSRELDHSIKKADERFYAALGKCFVVVKDGEKVKGNEISQTSKSAIVFDQLNAFLKSERIPAALSFGFGYWVIGLLLFFVFSMSVLWTIMNKFDTFDETMSLISVQNEILLPTNFANSFALLNSQGSFLTGMPSESNSGSMIREIVFSSVNSLKLHLNQRVNEGVTMNLWIDDQISAKIRSSFNKYIETTVQVTDLLTMTATALMDIQTDLSNNQNSKHRFDGYFSAINGIRLTSYFSDFSNEAINSNEIITSNTESIVLLVSIPIILGSIFIYGISFFYLFRYKRLQESFLKFFFHTDKLMLLRDVQRLEFLKHCVNGPDNMLPRYKFDIAAKDRFLQLEETHHQHVSTNSNKQNKARLPDIQLRHQSIFIFFVLIFISYLLLITVTFTYLEIFIGSYRTLVNRLNGFSKISFKASNLLIHRELCYAKYSGSFDASGEIEVDRVKELFRKDIDDLANDIQNLNGYLEDLSGLQFSLVDSVLLAQTLNHLNTDFCKDIGFNSTFFKQARSVYDGLCQSAEGGALQQGLVTALNYEKNKYSTEFKSTDSFSTFSARDYSDSSKVLSLQEEYISVYLLATEMAMINGQIIAGVNNKKDVVTFTLILIITISMGILGVFNIAVFFRGKNQLLKIYKADKYIVFLIPQLTLLTQPKFFNQFKNLVKKYNL